MQNFFLHGFMSVPEFLSKVIIRTAAERDELVWLPLSQEETMQGVTNGVFDIDFFLLIANARTFFSDATSLRLLFNNEVCEIFKTSFRQRLYSKKAPISYVIGRVGNFFITVLANESEQHNDDNNNDDFDSETEELSECTLDEVKNALASCIAGSYPLRQFTDIILNVFGTFDIVIYRMGQKAPLSDVSMAITELKKKYYVEIALAVEIEKSGFFVLARPQRSPWRSFSFLLSSQAANLTLKGNQIASLPGCFKLTAYSTSFHSRKKCKSTLGYEGGCESLKEAFKKSIEENCALVQRILNNQGVGGYSNSRKIRVEAYFVLQVVPFDFRI